MKVNAQTKLVGIIGWPVEHSLSPAMHNAAFAALGLNWAYVPLPVAPGQLSAAVRGLAALGFQGANVTIPHKEAVLPYLDELSQEARFIGAVNTIVIDGDRLIGHNTDAAGFMQALLAGGFRPDGARAVVIGAGGAARAVVYGLLAAGVVAITIVNRSLQRAEALVEDFARIPLGSTPWLKKVPLTAVSLSSCSSLPSLVAEADLLVNATPVGMWPRPGESPWPDDAPFPGHPLVFDLVYNPPKTKLLLQAQAAGARTIGGLEMLLYQGAKAFELWTGQKPPVEIMRTALREGLCSDFSQQANPTGPVW